MLGARHAAVGFARRAHDRPRARGLLRRLGRVRQRPPGGEVTVHVVLAGGGTAGHIEPALASPTPAPPGPGDEDHRAGHRARAGARLVPARGYDLALDARRCRCPRRPSADLLRCPAGCGPPCGGRRSAARPSGADVARRLRRLRRPAPAYLAARRLRRADRRARGEPAARLGEPARRAAHPYVAVDASPARRCRTARHVGLPMRRSDRARSTGPPRRAEARARASGSTPTGRRCW